MFCDATDGRASIFAVSNAFCWILEQKIFRLSSIIDEDFTIYVCI